MLYLEVMKHVPTHKYKILIPGIFVNLKNEKRCWFIIFIYGIVQQSRFTCIIINELSTPIPSNRNGKIGWIGPQKNPI